MHKICFLLLFIAFVIFSEAFQTNFADADSYDDVQGNLYPLHYKLGKRQHGDQLNFIRTKHHSAWTKKNWEATVFYPGKGAKGKMISKIEVFVNQTSPHGKMKVKAGGIGENFVILDIFGIHTKKFDWRVEIYGAQS